MIKNIIILVLIALLAWISRDSFVLELPDFKFENMTRYKKEIKAIEPITIKNKDKYIATPKYKEIIEIKKSKITLSMLLAQNKFYDALSFYLNDSTDYNMKKIENYLATLSNKNAILSLKYMKVFLENEPKSNILEMIIKTYIAQNDFENAIELIIEKKESYVSEDEDKRLKNQLKDVAIKHIDRLLVRKEYAKLIAFLEEMIAYDGQDSFYSFRLAKLYMSLDRTQDAAVLLETLQYDEVYEQNVKTLLESMDKEKEETYKYAIPLKKYGEHYAMNVLLDGNTFTLMLDTGATFIFVDEDKASMLHVIKNNLLLQTAGDDIQAQLCKVSNMQVGNLELSDIEVTIAPFKRDGIDGLLGMNFFKHFRFFLNQDESVLYLNPK